MAPFPGLFLQPRSHRISLSFAQNLPRFLHQATHPMTGLEIPCVVVFMYFFTLLSLLRSLLHGAGVGGGFLSESGTLCFGVLNLVPSGL